MQILKLKDMKGGWFVGNFEPTAFKTDAFEVSYKNHLKGEAWDHHYHHTVTEINLLIEGKMMLQGKQLQSGDVFILNPYEVANPTFIEDCRIICVKTPSANDKVIIKQ